MRQMNIVKELATNLHEVFKTEAGIIYQSDSERCVLIDFAGSICKFNYAQSLRLKKIIEAIDVDAMLLDTESASLEIVTLHGCDNVYILSVLQIIKLKELLQGAFVMFDLNNILKDCLQRTAV